MYAVVPAIENVNVVSVPVVPVKTPVETRPLLDALRSIVPPFEKPATSVSPAD